MLSTQWLRGDVQLVQARVLAAEEGLPSLEELRDLVGSVPAAVRKAFALEGIAQQLAGMQRRPKAESTKAILSKLGAVLEKFDAFFRAQQGEAAGAAGADASGASAAPAAAAAGEGADRVAGDAGQAGAEE